MRVFDTHCHLAAPELRPHVAELIRFGIERGLGALTLISADFPNLKENELVRAEILKAYPHFQVALSAGVHPHAAKEFYQEGVFQLPLWQSVVDAVSRAQAVGETGLDFYYNHSDKAEQLFVFHKHIDLAIESSKPLVIHCRNAADDVLNCLSRTDLKTHPKPGILHCFAESLDFARKVLDLNFYISFSGILTFKNADALREVARFVPLNRVLIETDSPWLAPMPHRGKKNQPAFVADVFTHFASLRSESPEEVSRALWENSCQIFSLSSAN